MFVPSIQNWKRSLQQLPKVSGKIQNYVCHSSMRCCRTSALTGTNLIALLSHESTALFGTALFGLGLRPYYSTCDGVAVPPSGLLPSRQGNDSKTRRCCKFLGQEVFRDQKNIVSYSAISSAIFRWYFLCKDAHVSQQFWTVFCSHPFSAIQHR